MDDSDASNASKFDKSLTTPFGIKTTPTTVSCQTKIEDPDIFNKLCKLCVGRELTREVKWNKSMTATFNKLKEIYANLWEPNDSPLQSRNTYATILICKHM